MSHIPVLLQDVLKMCEGVPFSKGWFLDGTFGRGGHSQAILEKFDDAKIIGLDCDADAVDHAREHFQTWITAGRFEIHRHNFSDFEQALGDRVLVGALLDLGVSSPQLDEGPRGFSFYHPGPLDMRMDQSQDLTAHEIVNTWDDRALGDIFREYGEVFRPDRAVQMIIERRREKNIESTTELASIIEKADGWRKKGYHPATNYFMALRIAVNQELGRLESILPSMVQRLSDDGRLLVITFHSLEDRIAKTAFRSLQKTDGLGHQVNKKVIQATWDEKKKNPRARSAKLRVFQREQREQNDNREQQP